MRVRSTKEKSHTNSDTISPPELKEHEIHTKLVDLQETLYTNQTGKFPHLLSKGNIYIMVATYIDSSYIFLSQ